jgi:Leucine-rich repeat (LRR) protein
MINHKTESTMTLGRDTSNQSTVDSGSGLSVNSYSDPNDPNARRMFGLASSTGANMQRRLRLLMDQCETVRFPFKKRLILANLSLSNDDIPVNDICSERLGAALYKLSLAGNQIHSIPEPLVLKLTGLRVLDVSQCGLRSLPDVWDLPSLKKLVVSHNHIQSFPAEVRMLLSLSIYKYNTYLPHDHLFYIISHLRVSFKASPSCNIWSFTGTK